MKTDGMSNAARLFYGQTTLCRSLAWLGANFAKNYLELLSSAIVVNSHIVKET